MTAWYEQSFGQDYLVVYKHRDMQGAKNEVQKMVNWLHLQSGAEIFDLCCGMGRHSLTLADYGYNVTGMDLSEVLLNEAIRLDTEGKVNWLRGDMRQIPLEKSFDAVVNLFTSFGYFTDEIENEKVIHEISRLLKADGRFIIDFLNPAYVGAHLVPHSQRVEAALDIEENRSIEDGYVRKRITIREEGHGDRHYLEQVRLYRLEDFKRMLATCDLVIDEVYGHYDGTHYVELESPRLIILGSKKGIDDHGNQ
ncbi:class I SAM-dependent methyltransferase [Paenibacillus psychroresistens]|uniref:Class I SAM-dependent methyltransferase n=1 Tax=Paenibacillus psychroresistens TaxID=1778678 RepID=A0A6B8RRK4_9BACL|nr:class I SAM-dependent methyltransferase [Paenibacillus psychroresistens]QGQ97898.1 class I SAM-dependent methyltransferase [Paenibacillus psychroresistens]